MRRPKPLFESRHSQRLQLTLGERRKPGLNGCERARFRLSEREATVRWTIKLEATTEWGDVQTFDVGRLQRSVVGLTARDIGLKLDEAKAAPDERRESERCARATVNDCAPRAVPTRRTPIQIP